MAIEPGQQFEGIEPIGKDEMRNMAGRAERDALLTKRARQRSNLFLFNQNDIEDHPQYGPSVKHDDGEFTVHWAGEPGKFYSYPNDQKGGYEGKHTLSHYGDVIDADDLERVHSELKQDYINNEFDDMTKGLQ